MITKPELRTLHITLALFAFIFMTGCVKKVIAPISNTNPETQIETNNKPIIDQVPPGYERDLIVIMFKESVDYCVDNQLFPEKIQKNIKSISRPFCDPESYRKNQEIHAESEKNLGKKIVSIYRMLTIRLEPTADPISVINEIIALPNVDLAQFLTKPGPLPN